MPWQYLCPKCNATLNPSAKVILLARHEERTILMGFESQPGSFDIYLPPDVELHPGSRWDFMCPVCRAELTLAEDDALCALVVESEGRRHRLLFSRIAGEHASFLFDLEGHLEERYGRAAEAYFQQMAAPKSFF